MKLYISADIEGTTGITLWDETRNGNFRHSYFGEQMSLEVAAACEGAMAAGCDDILVKDAHGSACNINPRLLPEDVRIFRGWSKDPMCMVTNLDESFDGIFFTGYHSAAGMDTNPLSHTMETTNNYVKINGELASELMINSLTAAMKGVPVRLVTGDKGLCDWIRSVNPNIETVAVNEGYGYGTLSIHPNKAIRLIREAAERAMAKPAADCMFPLPDHFRVEIGFKDHFRAKNAVSYPGVTRFSPTEIAYETSSWPDALRMLDWAL